MNRNGPPFQRREVVDEPGIVGARWWQESVADPIPRRQAIIGLLAFGGVLAGIATIGTCAAVASSGSSSSSSWGSGSSDDFNVAPRGTLEMQKEYGWDFGASGEALVFDGQSTQAFDKSKLATLDTDLAPNDARYLPFVVPTLFQAIEAVPKSQPAGDPSVVVPLKDALKPTLTPSMEAAYRQGQALASAWSGRAKDTAVIVDLFGAESVAFAAGAASVLEPIFLFDNWPHPRGVVPAHRTLASAAYYQPLFVKARDTRGQGAPALFVLDRDRLTPYTDEASQFDNRYLARVPSADRLKALGIKTVLYVGSSKTELDDLNEDFVAYAAKGIVLKAVEPSAIRPGFIEGAAPYVPTPRVTMYSSGQPATSAPAIRARPVGFGTMPVVIALGTGAILGAKMSRSGSWNRTTSSSSGS